MRDIEGKRFQIETTDAFSSKNDIRFVWKLKGTADCFVTFTVDTINAQYCDPYKLPTNAEFGNRGGILTFKKTETQLKIWFDNEILVDWDFSAVQDCKMKYEAEGIKFHLGNRMDTASKQIRFEGV